VTVPGKFTSIYSALLQEFLNGVDGAAPGGIPELHLPSCGSGYETSLHRLAFIGQDTGGWGEMENLLDAVRADPVSAACRVNDYLQDLEFLDSTNNFGTSFWDTVLRLLAGFHGIQNWKELKRGDHEHVLRSFLWANTNSLERYEVSARGKGVRYEDWIRFKTASEKFDQLELVLEAFTPKTVVILDWDSRPRYTPNELVWETISDHLEYARSARSGTHIFRAAHPTWLNQNDLYNETVTGIVERWKKLQLVAPDS
jgi:hypothetical protein